MTYPMRATRPQVNLADQVNGTAVEKEVNVIKLYIYIYVSVCISVCVCMYI
jgi:hypothetical protein